MRNLRRTGATVLEVDPETGRQWRVEAHGGHFGGSLDAVALGLLEAPKTWHVVEFKTHSAEELPRAGRQGRRRGQAPALGADAGLHAPDRAHARALRRGLQGHRRAAHRAGRGRRRRGRAAAREGRPRHLRRPAAGADQRGSRLVRVPILRPPRRLPWRAAPPRVTCRSCLHSHAGRRRLALRPHGPDARRQRDSAPPAPGISSSPISCPARSSTPAMIFVAYRMPDGTTWVNDARAEEVAAC